MRNKPYTPAENARIVAAYIMLAKAQADGEPMNKAQLVRTLIKDWPTSPARSRGSIEAKFMNCSAVADQYGLLPSLPNGYVKGYKPAPNYQSDLAAMLRDAVSAPGSFAQLATALEVRA